MRKSDAELRLAGRLTGKLEKRVRKNECCLDDQAVHEGTLVWLRRRHISGGSDPQSVKSSNSTSKEQKHSNDMIRLPWGEGVERNIFVFCTWLKGVVSHTIRIVTRLTMKKLLPEKKKS